MKNTQQDLAAPVDWKSYLYVVLRFLATFYLLTIALAAFFIHHGAQIPFLALAVGFLYLFIIIFSLVRMIKKLPMPALMLAAPTIPLCMLMMVLSLLPLSKIL